MKPKLSNPRPIAMPPRTLILVLLVVLASATLITLLLGPTLSLSTLLRLPAPTPTPWTSPNTSLPNPIPMHHELVLDKIEALTVTHLQRPADHVLADATFFNAPPDPGNEYIIITVRHRCIVSNVTNQRCRLIASNYTLTGSSNLTRHPEDARGLPEMMTAKPFYGGIIATGGILFQVAIDETDLVLIYDPWPWLDLPPGYFALDSLSHLSWLCPSYGPPWMHYTGVVAAYVGSLDSIEYHEPDSPAAVQILPDNRVCYADMHAVQQHTSTGTFEMVFEKGE